MKEQQLRVFSNNFTSNSKKIEPYTQDRKRLQTLDVRFALQKQSEKIEQTSSAFLINSSVLGDGIRSLGSIFFDRLSPCRKTIRKD